MVEAAVTRDMVGADGVFGVFGRERPERNTRSDGRRLEYRLGEYSSGIGVGRSGDGCGSRCSGRWSSSK